jgi:hypothetical protein
MYATVTKLINWKYTSINASILLTLSDFPVPYAFPHVVRTLANSAGCTLSVPVYVFLF